MGLSVLFKTSFHFQNFIYQLLEHFHASKINLINVVLKVCYPFNWNTSKLMEMISYFYGKVHHYWILYEVVALDRDGDLGLLVLYSKVL